LALPAAIKICEIVHGDKIKAIKALRSIPVSNDTIKRRIDCMRDYIKSQLLVQIKSSDTFSIQLDESTVLTNNSQLMVFVRYQYNLEINEDLIFCKRTRLVQMCWCMYRAVAMNGKITGFKADVVRVSPDIRFFHCIILREHLTFRKIGRELNSIMNDVVSMVIFVKTRALNSRLF